VNSEWPLLACDLLGEHGIDLSSGPPANFCDELGPGVEVIGHGEAALVDDSEEACAERFVGQSIDLVDRLGPLGHVERSESRRVGFD
jgi:hypothetical protein